MALTCALGVGVIRLRALAVISTHRCAELFLFRHQQHGHLPPFGPGQLIHSCQLRHVIFNTLEQFSTQFHMGHFSTTKPYGNFRAVAIFDKFNQLLQLDLVIAFVSARAKLDLFDVHLFLALALIVLLFLLLKPVFAVIN